VKISRVGCKCAKAAKPSNGSKLITEEKFFCGSDVPHAEGYLHPIGEAKKHPKVLPEKTQQKIVEENVAKVFGR
jgi:hypothetical protein